MPIFCNTQTTVESAMKKRITGDSAQAQTWITKIVKNHGLVRSNHLLTVQHLGANITS